MLTIKISPTPHTHPHFMDEETEAQLGTEAVFLFERRSSAVVKNWKPRIALRGLALRPTTFLLPATSLFLNFLICKIGMLIVLI